MSAPDLASCGPQPDGWNRQIYQAWHDCMTAAPAWLDEPAHVLLLIGAGILLVALVAVLRLKPASSR